MELLRDLRLHLCLMLTKSTALLKIVHLRATSSLRATWRLLSSNLRRQGPEHYYPVITWHNSGQSTALMNNNQMDKCCWGSFKDYSFNTPFRSGAPFEQDEPTASNCYHHQRGCCENLFSIARVQFCLTLLD